VPAGIPGIFSALCADKAALQWLSLRSLAAHSMMQIKSPAEPSA
jgi:hypothetical protein